MNETQAIGSPRRPLGIASLDGLLGGGLPDGNCLLVQGAPGTGKTLLGMQFLYEGAARFDAPGLLVTFEEAPCRLLRDAGALGWDFPRLEREGRLQVVYTSPSVFLKELEADRYGRLVREHNVQRLVIDNVSCFDALVPEEDPRLRSLRILNALRREDLAVMLLRELPLRDAPAPVMPEEYLSDTILQLEYRFEGAERVRLLEVLKNRGSSHSAARHRFVIAPGGLQIEPSSAGI